MQIKSFIQPTQATCLLGLDFLVANWTRLTSKKQILFNEVIVRDMNFSSCQWKSQTRERKLRFSLCLSWPKQRKKADDFVRVCKSHLKKNLAVGSFSSEQEAGEAIDNRAQDSEEQKARFTTPTANRRLEWTAWRHQTLANSKSTLENTCCRSRVYSLVVVVVDCLSNYEPNARTNKTMSPARASKLLFS